MARNENLQDSSSPKDWLKSAPGPDLSGLLSLIEKSEVLTVAQKTTRALEAIARELGIDPEQIAEDALDTSLPPGTL